MKFAKFALPILAMITLSASNAMAQSGCQTIDPVQGTADISFTPAGLTTPVTTCHFEPLAVGGMAIACIHGFQGSQANFAILAKVATRTNLTALEKSTLTNMTTIRGGFVMNSVGLAPGLARTTILANRTALNTFINSVSYSAADSMPSLLTQITNFAANSVSSVDLVNTSGSMGGFHAAGNIATVAATQFHVIMDTNNIDATYFLRIGSDMTSWQVCQGQPAGVNSIIHSIVTQFQTGGANTHKVMFK